MIEQLFGSKTRVKLLKLFYSNPNRSFYVREITRTVEEQINSVRRELANLLSLGIITSDSTNNRLYYEVNQSFEHYQPLRAMFSQAIEDQDDSTMEQKDSSDGKSKLEQNAKTKAAKPQQPATSDDNDNFVELAEAKRWQKAGNIDGIAYSGVYTRDEAAGVDVVIVGDVVASKIESVIADLEKQKHVELRYAVFTKDEWLYRRQVHDKFWLQFMSAKMQVVYDKDEIFNKQ